MKDQKQGIDYMGMEPATSTKTSRRWLFLLALQIRNRAPTIRSPKIPPTVPSIKPIFELWDPPVR
jgi:hypothetical protein